MVGASDVQGPVHGTGGRTQLARVTPEQSKQRRARSTRAATHSRRSNLSPDPAEGSAASASAARRTRSKSLVRSVGWLSLGVGLAGLLAPRRTGGLIGLQPKHDLTVRIVGLHGLASGVGLIAGASRMRDASVRLSRSIAVERPAAELFAFWREPENFPRFMPFLECVRPSSEEEHDGGAEMDAGSVSRSDGPSRWVVEGPTGARIACGAEITEDVPNEHIAWRSNEESDVVHSGSICFDPTPEGRGTVVLVQIDYEPPGGSFGAAVAELVEQGPEWVLANTLRRFRQLIEVGEIVTTVGQPAGRSHTTSKRYDAATRL